MFNLCVQLNCTKERKRKMKKVLLTLVAVVALGCMTNVSAMTEEELFNTLSQPVTVNGKQYTIPADKKVLLERYFEQNEVSSEDADYIAAKYTEAKTLAAKIDATSYNAMSATDKEKFITIVSEVKENTKVDVTLSENGVLTVKNQDGSIVTVDVTESIIKTTGSNVAIIAIAGLVSLIGVSVIAKKVSKANA